MKKLIQELEDKINSFGSEWNHLGDLDHLRIILNKMKKQCDIHGVVVPRNEGTLFCKCLVPEQNESYNATENKCRCGGKIAK